MFKIIFYLLLTTPVVIANSSATENCKDLLKKCEKINVLYENEYEKLFEFKDSIYKKEKSRKRSTLFILDVNRKEYIQVGYRD
jgi:hypothetical protein